MQRSGVSDFDLKRRVPGTPDQILVAANQAERADNVIPGSKSEKRIQIWKVLCELKANKGVVCIVVPWTANTEHYSDVREGMHETAEKSLRAIEENG